MPVTFSPPSPVGGTYVPSAEDSLRDGILLMFKADDVTRRDLSYDPNNPAKGVRIFAGPWAATEGGPKERKFVLPQLLITSSFAATKWNYATGKSGEKKVTIVVSLLEPLDSGTFDMSTDAFAVTAEAKFRRFERVLQCGTVLAPDQEEFSPRVVDPYYSPLNEDGTYDPDSIKWLNELGPEMSRQVQIVTDGDNKPVAVAYMLIAAYTVNVRNRELMEAGYS